MDKIILGDSNPFIEDSNPLFQEPKVSKINLRDLNLFFENSNPPIYFRIKTVHISKMSVFFSKLSYTPFQNLIKFVTIMLLTQNFFKTHTHTHYRSSSFIITFIKNLKSVMNPSQSKGTKLKSTAAQSLKEKGRGQSS